ncbi:MAG: cytochrome ubiquinol oxidase subunit I [Pseudomonadota bacterium]
MDALLLARIQFAANISFHILFPTITIALGWVLLWFKWQQHRSIARGRDAVVWRDLHLFWTKVFALCFALGVVSGITMSFQFGTNWPGFMEAVGAVAGPLLAYEVLTAFFLEATFLGIMLFGQRRVPNWLHTLATALVAIGTSLSAFWILVLNSWMHTPAGVRSEDGVVVVESWTAVIFNPSMPYRLSHMLVASVLTVAFLIIGLSAYRVLKGDRGDTARTGLRTGAWLAALAIPVQIVIGDLHGLNTLEHQPAKIAAMEGVWDTQRGAPLLLFAVPDEAARTNHAAIGIPKGAAFILTHDWNGELTGLNDFDDHPPVAPLFYGFRLMVGVGTLMLVTSWWFVWQLRRRGDLSRPALFAAVSMTFSGWVATLAGWYVTEIGRQPWLVEGLLRTSEAAGPATGTEIGLSLGLYLTLYAGLLSAFIWTLFYLARKAAGLVDDAEPAYVRRTVEVTP